MGVTNSNPQLEDRISQEQIYLNPPFLAQTQLHLKELLPCGNGSLSLGTQRLPQEVPGLAGVGTELATFQPWCFVLSNSAIRESLA